MNINKETLKERKISMPELVLIICLFALYLLPSVSIGSTTVLMLLLMFCVYLMAVDKEVFPVVLGSLALITLLAVAYTFLTDASSIAQDVSGRDMKRFISKFYQYLALYFPAILFIRISKSASRKQKKILVIAGVVLMVYVIISTWLFLIENPDATRQWENFETNSAYNVANFYFIYSVPVMISILAIVMLKVKRFSKLIAFAALLAAIWFLVKAQYTLSILIAIIGVLIQLYRSIRTSVGKVLFVSGMALFVVFLPQLLEMFISIIPSEQVSERLTEIHRFLTGQGTGGYNLNGRLTLYGRTVLAFLESPLWGNARLGFDGHATFLTVLADTGILGAIPFYTLLWFICRRIRRELPMGRPQINVIIFMFVMMGLTNPIHASFQLGFTAWFLAPLTIQLLLKEDSQNETALEN